MTTQSNEQATQTIEVAAPAEAKEMSFKEYETLRREGKPIVTESAPPAKQEEQKPVPESETEEKEEAEQEAEGSEEDQEASAEKSKKHKSGFQRRVDKLNAKAAKAEQERDYWRSLVLEKKEASEQKPEKAEVKAQQDGKPDPEKFESHAEYVEALTDWKLEQREKAAAEKAKAEQAKTETQKLIESHNKRLADFVKSKPDFHEALEEVEDVKVSAALQELLVTSDLGPALMYELAKNRSELERISGLSPVAAARELGKIEAKLSAPSPEEPKPEIKKTTSAPKPIEPVGGSKGPVRKSIHDPDISFSEYEARRREQIKRRA